ncbi:MAG: mechanosensitive ion channel family protein [Methanomassiliicoccales archaeon]|nr:mechanosensitive ion channel family protein [Methanomassiliicoccales archaeon]
MADEIIIGEFTLGQILAFVFIILITLILAKAANALLRRYLDDRVSRNWSKGVARIAQYVILGLGLYIGFDQVFRFSLSALLASLGILGLAVAFASQQVIQNAIAGILISITRPIRLEDWVEIGGIPDTGIGRVKDITLLTTVLRDTDGRMSFVPNSMILTTKVINYTRSGFVAVHTNLTIPSISDFNKLQELVIEVADEDPLIMPNVAGEEKSAIAKLFETRSIRVVFEHKHDPSALDPKVTITSVSESKVEVMVRFWIREISKKDEIISGFLREVCSRLEKEGVMLVD